MSSRYFVTHQTVTLTCSTLLVEMTTHTAQHLWLLWTTKPPFVRPRPFRNQESERPHQNNYSLEIHGDVEQREPGDTKQHTFELPFPYTSTRIFFYSINMGSPAIKATRSPIFAYDIVPRILFTETWSVTGKPDLPWFTRGTPPPPMPYNGGGNVNLRGSIDTADVIFLDLAALLGTDPATLCNLFIRVKIGHWQFGLPTDDGQGEVSIIFANAAAQTAARNGLFTFATDPCVGLPTNYVYPASIDATVGFPVSPMLDPLPNLCGQPNDPPIPNAYASELRLFSSSSGPFNPPREWFFNFGEVQIGTTTGTAVDVSGQWRHKRIAPFLA